MDCPFPSLHFITLEKENLHVRATCEWLKESVLLYSIFRFALQYRETACMTFILTSHSEKSSLAPCMNLNDNYPLKTSQEFT